MNLEIQELVYLKILNGSKDISGNVYASIVLFYEVNRDEMHH